MADNVLDTVENLTAPIAKTIVQAPSDIVNVVANKLTPITLPDSVDDYRSTYKNISPKVTDEQIAAQVYNAGVNLGKIKNTSFDQFKLNFLPNSPENSISAYRDKYQNTNPEIASVPDAELANAVYDARKNKGDKIDFIPFMNKFAPRDYNNTYNQDLTDEMGNVYGPNDAVKKQVRPDYTTDQAGYNKIAELADVATDSTIPTGAVLATKYAQGFAANPDNEVLAAKNALNQFFNPNNEPDKTVQVRIGPKTNQTEFLNPETKKWTLIDSPGFNYTDLAKQAGNSLTIGATILGDLYGFAGGATVGAAGGPAGVVAGGTEGAIMGGAIMGGIGEAARVYLGQTIFGINKDVSPIAEGGKQALINAGLGALGSYFKPTMEWLANYTKTGRVNVEELKKITNNATEAKQLFDDVNDTFITNNLPDRLKYTLGQATNNADLLATQAAFENNKAYGKTGFFNTWNDSNARALDVYFGLQNKTALSSTMTEDQLGLKISNIINDYKNSILKPLQDKQDQTIYDLTSATQQLPNGTLKESGMQIRNAIQTLQDNIKTEPGGFNDRFAALFKVGENRMVGNDLIINALNEIDMRQKATLFNQYPNIYEIIKKPEGGVVSVQTLANTISDLKAYDRQNVKSIGGMTPYQGAVKTLRDSMDAQLAKDLPANDPWLKEYTNLKDEYKEFKNRFDGAIGNILQLRNGRLALADEDVFNTTFKTGKGSQARIDSVYDVLKDNPDAMNTYRNSILDFYNNNVVNPDTKLVDIYKHNKFVNNFQYGLKRFFGEDNYGDISKIGGLAKSVEDANNLYSTTLDGIKKSTAGEIDSLKPDRIFSTVYNPAEPTRLKNVINLLKNNPEVLQNFQDVIKKDIGNSIKDADGQFNFVKLNTYLKNNLQNLQTVFFDDPKYVKNLQNLNGVLQILSRKSSLGGTELNSFANSALTDYVRMRVGMFTKEGRVVTMAQKFINYAKLDRMKNILTNPEYVDNLIKMNDIKLPKYIDYGTTLQTPSSTLTYGPFKFNTPLDQQKWMKQISLYNQMGTQLFGMKLIDNDTQPPLSSYQKYENQLTDFPAIKKLNQPTNTIKLNNSKNTSDQNSPTLNKINQPQSSLQNPVNTNITNPQVPNKDLFAMNVKPSGAGVTAGGMSSIPQGELAEAGALSRL